MQDHEALKEALKNIKSDFNPDQGDSSDDTDPSRFRTMDELKEALGEVQLNMETDLEVLTQLVDQFRQTEEESDKVSCDWSADGHVTLYCAQVTILEDLEYYVHQYDNALLFADLGGVKDIVTPSLNSRYGLGLMPIWQSLDLLPKKLQMCVNYYN